MRTVRAVVASGLAALALLLLVTPVSTRSNSGSIVGTITDKTGAVVPGASVTARLDGRDAKRAAVSDTKGKYRVAGLTPGKYTVTVELRGFKRMVAEVAVRSAKTTTQNFVLEVAGAPETIRVTSESGMGGAACPVSLVTPPN